MERECSDEHEEGEIIDDFEDISDYSIRSTSYSGKSVSHQDLLQDVSLSSISDNEPDAVLYGDTYNSRIKRTKRKKKVIHSHRKKRHKSNECYHRHRLSKYLSSTILSSDSEEELDAKTQKQLKDAIRIDRSQIHHNSLRTRLKAMLQNENAAPKSGGEDEDIEALRTLALLSNVKTDNRVVEDDEKSTDTKLNDGEIVDEKDEELIELRLAALKSAVLRKVPEIRRRKFKQHPNQNKNKICEINKENNVNQENNIKEDPNNVKDAELLEGIKNINDIVAESEITNNEISRNTLIEEDIDIMRAKLLASMSKKIASNLPVLPKEKPDTKVIKPISTHTNLYVKQHVKVKPLIINLNDSDSDTDVTLKKDENDVKEDISYSVSEFLKKQRAAVEAKKNIDAAPSIKERILDKSVVKLLPKSQQKEYHLLKQKLLMARKKRLRKTSLKIDNNKSVIVKKCTKETATRGDINLKQSTENKLPGFQKTIDDICIKNNGRLQIKGKYKTLAPLLHKINQASIGRKQFHMEIKTLLESLRKARDKLAVNDQNYNNLVECLKNEKHEIDQRVIKMPEMKIVNNNINIIKNTSTPVKPNIQESVCDISAINNSQDNVKEVNVNHINIQTDTESGPPVVNNDPIPTCNDVNNALKQYVSPLDNKNRDTVEDPLITFCPFELFGVCKDPECKFNHCSKA